MFSAFIAFVLIVAILPSTASLSTPLTGPFNIVKLTLPLLFLFVVLRRKILLEWFSNRALLGAVILFGLAGLGTITGTWGCEDKGEFFKTVIAFFSATLVTVCLFCLEEKWQKRVVWGWAIILVASVILDQFFPGAVEYLSNNVFDPENLNRDNAELRYKVLSGIYSRHAISRFLALTPFIFLIFSRSRVSLVSVALLLATYGGIILRTTQRGSHLAFILGLFALILHFYRKNLFSKKPLLLAAAVAVISFASAKVLVQSEIYKARFVGNFNVEKFTDKDDMSAERMTRDARTTASYRTILWKISAEQIAKHPFGNACPAREDFWVLGARPRHSHNIYIEQTRVRGWLFGLAFAVMWVFALIRSWALKGMAGALAFGGVVACSAMGLVDDPLRTIGQDILFSTLILLALVKPQKFSKSFSAR